MPVELTKEVKPGMFFGAVSKDYALELPAVVIPIAHIAAMTDAEIGAAARALIPFVDFARALAVADWFNGHGNTGHVPTALAEETHQEQHALLRRFAGHDPEIDKALG